jgi:hypothetical protein
MTKNRRYKKMPKMELQTHISELIDLDKVEFVRELLIQISLSETNYIQKYTYQVSLNHFDDLMVQIREALEGFGVNTDK